MRKRHAIIIGAGVAGLTAAYYFLKHTDIKPVVLEKEKFVGGLARTMNFDGNRLDIGDHKFFSKNADIIKLWQEILPAQDDFAVNEKISGRDAIFYRREFFSYPVEFNFSTIRKLGLLETILIGASIFKGKFSQREENTLEDLIVNRFGQRLYENFFRDFVTKIFGRTPQEIGADFVTKIFGSSTPERVYRCKLGAGQMWDKFADEIKRLGGEVLTGSNVKSMHVDAKKIVRSVRAESPAGMLTFPANYFLSTMPLNELAEAMDDGLNYRQLQIARGLPYRDLIIVGLLVDKLAANPAGQIYVQEPSVKLGRVQIVNNVSPNMVADPENSVWLGLEYFCDAGDDLWQMNNDDCVKFATDELASIGLVDAAASVKFGVRVKVPKAYPAYFDTCENIGELHAALDEIQNLYCIGRNGQHRQINMDTGMLTAIAAVCAIAEQFPKPDIWKIYAEQTRKVSANEE